MIWILVFAATTLYLCTNCITLNKIETYWDAHESIVSLVFDSLELSIFVHGKILHLVEWPLQRRPRWTQDRLFIIMAHVLDWVRTFGFRLHDAKTQTQDRHCTVASIIKSYLVRKRMPPLTYCSTGTLVVGWPQSCDSSHQFSRHGRTSDTAVTMQAKARDMTT